MSHLRLTSITCIRLLFYSDIFNSIHSIYTLSSYCLHVSIITFLMPLHCLHILTLFSHCPHIAFYLSSHYLPILPNVFLTAFTFLQSPSCCSIHIFLTLHSHLIHITFTFSHIACPIYPRCPFITITLTTNNIAITVSPLPSYVVYTIDFNCVLLDIILPLFKLNLNLFL